MFIPRRRWPDRSARPRTFRPCLECLEGREVPTATTTALTATPNPATIGQTITLTATITGGDFAGGSDLFVTDQVTFLDGATKLGTVTPKATGGPNHESRAQFTTSGLSAGPHSLTAKYSGGFDPIMLLFNDASTSGAVSAVVNVPPAPLPPPPVSDVSGQVSVTRGKHGRHPGALQLTLRDVGGATVQGPVYLVLDGLPKGVRLKNAAGFTRAHAHHGDPFLVANVSLLPGGEVAFTLFFRNPGHKHITFTTEVLAGPGPV
jgi:hypothetical protein